MQVKVAKRAGFCMGVRRALNEAIKASTECPGTVCTYGPLIHNKQVVNLLQRRKVGIVDAAEQVSPGDTVVIRAHGIPPDQEEAIKKAGGNVRNATCPHVKRAQNTVEKAVKAGANVIIVGDRGHAEVDGLLGYTDGKGYVVENAEEVRALPPMEFAWIVAQTTQSDATFQQVTEAVKKRVPHIEITKTICGSTSKRQEEVLELSKEVDVIIVVGGKHSANTIRLAQLARESSVPTIHIETAEELDASQLKQHKTAGVTAGASTPNWIIEEVIDKLKRIEETPSLVSHLKKAASFVIQSHLFLSIGTAALAAGLQPLADLPRNALTPLLAGLYIFSMQNVNMYLELRHGELIPAHRRKIYEKFSFLLVPLGILTAVLSLVLAIMSDPLIFYIIAFSTVLGALYTIRILPRHWNYQRLKDIPGSKNLFFAGAIAVVTVLLPTAAAAPSEENVMARLFSTPSQTSLLPALFYAATIAFIRSITLDLQNFQRDQFAGLETISTLMGIRKIKLLGTIVTTLCALTVAVFALSTGTLTNLFHLLPLLYIGTYLWLYRPHSFSQGFTIEFFIDLSFYTPLLITFIILNL